VQLSRELGVHESTISNWELGHREPKLNMLIAISKYFNLYLSLATIDLYEP
jgi:transcriptional regulator with XRE-family HTH domain